MGKCNSLNDGGCAHGTYFDRLVSVQNNDLIEGPFCFGYCDEVCSEESSVEYELIWNDEFDGNGSMVPQWYHQTQLQMETVGIMVKFSIIPIESKIPM